MAVALQLNRVQAVKVVLKRVASIVAMAIARLDIAAAPIAISRNTITVIIIHVTVIRVHVGTIALARVDTNTRRRTMGRLMLRKVLARFNFLS